MSQVDVYTEPPSALPDGVQLRLYSNPICPYAQRVRLIAAAKGISTEEINIHLKVKPDWYLEKINLVGKVPTIQLPDGRFINESLIASEYIDEAFDGKRMWPADPYLKAQARLFIDAFGNKVNNSLQTIIRTIYRETTDDTHNTELAKYLVTLEEKLRSSSYFSGTDEPNAVDLLIWPWFERIETLQTLRPNVSAAINKDKFPLIFGWISRMKENDAVKQSYIPPENHLIFLRLALQSGGHDYSGADLTGKGVIIYTKKDN